MVKPEQQKVVDQLNERRKRLLKIDNPINNSQEQKLDTVSRTTNRKWSRRGFLKAMGLGVTTGVTVSAFPWLKENTNIPNGIQQIATDILSAPEEEKPTEVIFAKTWQELEDALWSKSIWTQSLQTGEKIKSITGISDADLYKSKDFILGYKDSRSKLRPDQFRGFVVLSESNYKAQYEGKSYEEIMASSFIEPFQKELQEMRDIGINVPTKLIFTFCVLPDEQLQEHIRYTNPDGSENKIPTIFSDTKDLLHWPPEMDFGFVEKDPMVHGITEKKDENGDLIKI